jgi:chromosome segregation ATPase
MAQEKTITELYEFLQEHMVTKGELKGELKKLKEDLEAKMATKEELKKTELGLKDHIDDKLADLKGDLTILMRKEDHKLLYLVKLLKEKNVISDEEVKELINMEPFPKPSL